MEEKLRTFIAIELDQEIKQTIKAFEDKLKTIAPSGLRWVKPDQIHLTLKFLGDITPTQVKEVSLELGQIAKERHCFQLQISGTGSFPNWNNPRSLWIGLGWSESLQLLFQQLDSVLVSIGFTPEGKPFKPHLTLCRVSDHVDPRMVQPLRKELETFSFQSLPRWFVNELVLFNSTLQPGGPIYTPISRHVLK